MRAGVVEATITPALGTHLSGYGTRDPANAVHDDLRCSALVLEEGETRLGLLTCDLVGLPVAVVQDWRPYLAAGSGIPAANILINCSHTHAGPVTGMLQETFGERERAYREHLKHALAGALAAAAAKLQPAQIRVAASRLRTQRNRRDRPDRPPGPIDDAIGVLCVDGLDGAARSLRPLATIVHYACHPVALREQNLGFSADYVGWVRQALQQARGAPCLFLQGACGELVPELPMVTVPVEGRNGTVARVSPDVQVQLGAAQQIGQAIGQAAAAAAQASAATTQHAGHSVALAGTLRTFAADLMAPSTPPGTRTAAPLALPFEVQCLRVGPLAIVGLPVEPLCAVGLAIQQLGPFRSGVAEAFAGAAATIWCAGYSNGCYGYLPPETAYAYGGYEVARAHEYYQQPAPFAPSTAARVVAAADDGLTALFRASKKG